MSSWDMSWHEQLAYCGKDVFIGNYCMFLSPHKVILGHRTRIDPFCNITCGLKTGKNVHISSHVFLNGGQAQTVKMGNWTFIGSGSRVIAASDNFSGLYGPIGPWGKNRMDREDVIFNDFSGIAIGTTLLPGVELPEGTCVSGHGWVDAVAAEQMQPWAVYACVPGREPKYLYMRDEKTVRAKANDPEFVRHGG